MSDRGIDQPRGNSAAYTLSTRPGVAATVSYVRDGDRYVIVDPGMAAHRDRVLGPLAELGLGPDDITDVVLSHHHPDNTLNVGLLGQAGVHDHKAEYRNDRWTDRDAEVHELTPSLRLIRAPGHSPEGITFLAGTADGVVAFAGDLWWRPAGPVDGPAAPDRDTLRCSRLRVPAGADVIIPGHSGPSPAGEGAPL
ncbi:MBL fold metallo-hydrolase [Streptomyces globisporus]|uniref:MBL fold metallo-hydrolase n=1 Tax=Streptomyces globisporus TaxID=1908 RepID=UPI001F3F95FD|nr:MBL fold metallo-hydrolase [Streptomyces globisporus]